MPSPFDAIDAAMQAVIDRQFGEGIRVIPQIGDQYTKTPDPERPAVEGLRATVARAPQARPTDFNGTARNGAPVSSSPAELWIDRAAYAAIGYPLRRGDIIELTDDPTAPRYTVGAVNPGDGGDVQIILG